MPYARRRPTRRVGFGYTNTIGGGPAKRARYASTSRPYRKLVKSMGRRGGRYANTRVQRIVRRELRKNAEVKERQATQGVVASNTGSTFFAQSFVDIAQGLGVDQRVGDAVKVIGFLMKATFRNTTTNPIYIRASLFLLTNEFGTDSVTSASDLLESMDGLTTAPSTVYDTPPILDWKLNKKGVIKLRDVIIKLSRSNTDEKGDYQRRKWFVKMNRPIQFDKGTQGANAQDTRLVYMINSYNPNNTAGTPTAFTFSHSFEACTYYTDS